MFRSTIQKNYFKRHTDFLLIEEKVQCHYVLIKDFSTFVCNQILHRNRQHICRYCFKSFSAAQLLERYANNCFEINGNQMIGKWLKKVKVLNSKTKQKEIVIHDLC